jgi:hypothetical protein
MADLCTESCVCYYNSSIVKTEDVKEYAIPASQHGWILQESDAEERKI